MRQWLFLFLLVTGIRFPAFSQAEMSRDDSPPKGYLAITFGPCLVTGSFAKDQFFSEDIGFVKNRHPKNGYQYSIAEFGFKFIPNFGLAAALKGGIIPQDVQALADNYAKEYGGQFTVTSTRWGYTGFFLGPFASIPTRYVDLDIRFQTGLLFAESPEMSISRDPEVIYQYSSVGASFALQAGIGTRIHLTKKFGLIAQAEYQIADPVFDVDFYDNNNSYGNQQISQVISTFNFSFGVVYRMF